MSSPIANVEIVEVVVAQKVARVKKPALPAKYNKFMSFGFWFLNKMDATVRDQLFPELKLFSTIEDQSAFFQTYLDEASASNKIMRKTVAAFHKPPKVRAEKKSRKSSKPVAAESDDLIAKLIADANGSTEPAASGDAPVQEKPKKSRKSTKKTEEPVEPVAETGTEAPVQEKPKKATKKSTKKAEEPVETTTVAPATTDAPVQEKPKKATKKSTKKAEEPVAPTDTPLADAPVQEKPKKATKKSTKKAEEPVAPPAAAATEAVSPDDDSDEIQTRIVTIDGGKQYLIDSEYNLYDISSHEQIGKFDPETNQPILA